MPKNRSFERKTARSFYAKERLLEGNLTDIGEMLDVYKVPEDVKRDPEVLTAMKQAIKEARERIEEWQKDGLKVGEDALRLPNQISEEFDLED